VRGSDRWLRAGTVRELPRRRRHIRHGREPRHELFELLHRLVFGLREHAFMVLGREVRLDAMDTAQMELPAGYHREQDGKAVCEARRADALHRRGLRHVAAPHQKCEQRRVSLSGPQLPPVDKSDVPEQAGEVVVISSDQLAECIE
jgi:hypothetical protein